MRNPWLRTTFTGLFLAFLLGGCGGGSSNSDGSDEGHLKKPAAVVASFPSTVNPLFLDHAHSADWATWLTIEAIGLTGFLAGSGTAPQGVNETVDEMHAGPQGGTVRIWGEVKSSGRGSWLVYDYDDYVESGMLVNGRIVEEGLTATSVDVSFHGTSFEWAGEKLTVRGAVQTKSRSASRIANLSVDYEPGGLRLALRNFAVDRVDMESDVKGEILFREANWFGFSVVTKEALEVVPGRAEYESGTLKLTNGTTGEGSTASLEFLNRYFASFQVPGDNGLRARRFAQDWQQDVEDALQQPGPPTATAAFNRTESYMPKQRIALDGRYSVARETGFLSFDWKLVSKPAHSQASLGVTNKPTVEITPDVEGFYVVALEVTDDAGRKSVDVATLDIREDGETWEGFYGAEVQLFPMASGHAGAVADFRVQKQLAQRPWVGKCNEESGFVKVFHDLSFLSVSCGWYTARQPDWNDLYPFTRSYPVVTLDEALFGYYQEPFHVQFEDIDGDGLIDIIFTPGFIGDQYSDPDKHMPGVYFSRNLGDGQYGYQQRVALGNSTYFGVGDMTGDGIIDLVASENCGYSFAKGSGDGVFASSEYIASLDDCPPGSDRFPTRALVLADIDGNGRLAVVAATRDGSGIEIIRFNESGVLVAQEILQLNAETHNSIEALFVIDADRDGKDEVVVHHGSKIILVHQTSDEVFETTNLSGLVRRVIVGDFDGDGSDDLVTLSNEHVLAVHLSSGDGFRLLGELDLRNDPAFSWRALDWYLLDLNGDGRNELVHIGETATRVIRTESGELSELKIEIIAAIAAGHLVGKPSVSDLDGDGLGELLLPTTKGIVSHLQFTRE